MNMKKMILAMGAALAAVMGASPASAAIYKYTAITNGEVLTIDTTKKKGTLIGANTNLTFASDSLGTFVGGVHPGLAAILSSISGSTTALGTVLISSNGKASIQILADKLYFGTVTFQGLVTQDLSFGDLTNFTIISEPTDVPEPAMLGLFGAGAVMVMMGRRRRAAGKAQGSNRLAMA